MIYSLTGVMSTCDMATAFQDIDVAVLIGSMPRHDGMERRDLLKGNANIFRQHGEALDRYAKKTVKVWHLLS